MKTALIRIEIGTVNNGKLVRNEVTLEIPQEAADIINKAWHTEELPQRNAIIAHNLLGNQIAHCDLIIRNEIAAGMYNMAKEDSDDERYFSIAEYEDEED